MSWLMNSMQPGAKRLPNATGADNSFGQILGERQLIDKVDELLGESR